MVRHRLPPVSRHDTTMHARLAGWQSVVFVVAVLSSLVAGVVVARADELVDELSAQPHVVAAEIDTVYAALGGAGPPPASVPIGGADGPERARQWGLDMLRADRVWSQAHACGRTIAVIDSGVNDEHADLAGTVGSGKRVVGNGGRAYDTSGHGTEGAGVAPAAPRKGHGISGMGPRVRIMPPPN